LSKRRTRPPPKRKSQSRDSEAPQEVLVATVSLSPPPMDAADDTGPVTRTGDELAALDAAWDDV
jgi:hypothetical protein